MIERHFCSLQHKIRRSTLVSEQITGFLPYFNKASLFFILICAFYRKQMLSCPAFFVSYHAVYSDYIPGTAVESPVLLLFFLSAEVSGIHNRLGKIQPLISLRFHTQNPQSHWDSDTLGLLPGVSEMGLVSIHHSDLEKSQLPRCISLFTAIWTLYPGLSWTFLIGSSFICLKVASGSVLQLLFQPWKLAVCQS